LITTSPEAPVDHIFFFDDFTGDKATGMLDIAGCGVFRATAVVIDGEVKCVGRISSPSDVDQRIAGSDGRR
jgi:hypothetical protein